MTLGWIRRCANGICFNYISLAVCKTAVSLLLTHWRYCSLALSHLYVWFDIIRIFRPIFGLFYCCRWDFRQVTDSSSLLPIRVLRADELSQTDTSRRLSNTRRKWHHILTHRGTNKMTFRRRHFQTNLLESLDLRNNRLKLEFKIKVQTKDYPLFVAMPIWDPMLTYGVLFSYKRMQYNFNQ